MPPPILFHGEIWHRTSHIKNLGQPSVPIDTNIVDTFSPPPLSPNQIPCTPSPTTPMRGAPSSATASNGAHRRSKLTIVNPLKWPPCHPCSNCLPRRRSSNRATGRCQQVHRTDLLHQNRRRRPIRGCGHRHLQPHRRC
jgi:hypothetical protein